MKYWSEKEFSPDKAFEALKLNIKSVSLRILESIILVKICCVTILEVHFNKCEFAIHIGIN